MALNVGGNFPLVPYTHNSLKRKREEYELVEGEASSSTSEVAIPLFSEISKPLTRARLNWAHSVNLLSHFYKKDWGKGRLLSLSYLTERFPEYFHPQKPLHYHPTYAEEDDTPFALWEASSTKLPYKEWLKKRKNPFVHASVVTYLNETERQAYQLEIKNGKIGKVINGEWQPYTSNQLEIFVLSPSGKIYSGVQEVGNFHHSSFLSGEAVKAVGEWQIKEGTILRITNESGHYIPSTHENLKLLQLLKTNDVDLKLIEFGLLGPMEELLVIFNADEYLQSSVYQEGKWHTRSQVKGFGDTLILNHAGKEPYDKIKIQAQLFDLIERLDFDAWGIGQKDRELIDLLKYKNFPENALILDDDDKLVGVDIDWPLYDEIQQYLIAQEPDYNLMVLNQDTLFGRVFIANHCNQVTANVDEMKDAHEMETDVQKSNEPTEQHINNFIRFDCFLSENFFFVQKGDLCLILVAQGDLSSEEMKARCERFCLFMENRQTETLIFDDGMATMNWNEFKTKYATMDDPSTFGRRIPLIDAAVAEEGFIPNDRSSAEIYGGLLERPFFKF